mgnify:FL=1
MSDDIRLGIVLTGGGARAAYQVGVLHALARATPELPPPVLVGVSAGSVNAALLAQHRGPFARAAAALAALWQELSPERVFTVAGTPWRWRRGDCRSLLDPSPLRAFLEEALGAVEGRLTGVAANAARGRLLALAIGSTSYTTGETVAWVEGAARPSTPPRPGRRTEVAALTVDHILASCAMPFLFPAVRLGSEWHGDGGVRLVAPLSPALHLGVNKLLVISPRPAAPSLAVPAGPYPSVGRVLGLLYHAVFLDVIDQDTERLRSINRLVAALPPERRGDLRVVELLVVRPSREPAALATAYRPRLPRSLRALVRLFGAGRAQAAELLSMLMFQGDYLQALLELGAEDGARLADRWAAFLQRPPVEHQAA